MHWTRVHSGSLIIQIQLRFIPHQDSRGYPQLSTKAYSPLASCTGPAFAFAVLYREKLKGMRMGGSKKRVDAQFRQKQGLCSNLLIG